MHFDNSIYDGTTKTILMKFAQWPRKPKCNLTIPGGIIQNIPFQNLHYEKKKSKCYSTTPFKVYTQLKLYLQNEKYEIIL